MLSATIDFDDLIGLAEEAARNRRLAAKHIKALALHLRSGKQAIEAWYNLLRLASSQIDDREQVAEFWKNRLEASEKQLAGIKKAEDQLKEADDFPHRKLLLSAIKSWRKAIEDTAEVIRGHYELHA
jgi:DNA repair exonuclease SbcCD ATPase subunit